MSSCLNISKEELKAYNKIGVSLFEVNRDWVENGTLRSPRAIKHKLDLINSESNDKWYEWKSQQDQFVDNVKEFDNKTAQDWLFQLSKSLNVKSKIITEQEAKEIHTSKQKTYDGEPAFFADDIVYLIEGKFTTESVVHEFSHPIIKSLSNEVRNKLYFELLENGSFQDIIDDVNESYAGYPESIKEEVLVRALTRLVSMETLTPELKTWFEKIMYQIRQRLRKLIGRKVNVGKLQADTTLKGLAEMLAKGDVLKLKKKMITGTNIIEYFKDKQKFIETFNNINIKDEVDQRFINDTMGKIFKAVDQQRADILKNPKMLALTDVFMDELLNTRLQEIQKLQEENPKLKENDIIDHFSKRNDDTIPEISKVVEERMGNLMHTLYKVNDIFTEGNKKIDALKNLDSKTKLDTLIYFRKHMLSYEQSITDFNAIGMREEFHIMEEDNVTTKKDVNGEPIVNPVSKLARDLLNNLNSMRSKIDKLQKDAVLDVFVELMTPSADKALKKFNDEMTGKSIFGKNMLNAPQGVRDSAYKAFHQLKEAEYKRYKKLKSEGSQTKEYKELHEMWITGLEFDRSKAEAILDGSAQDASYANGIFESLSNNADAAISSVYAHLRAMTDIYDQNAQSWMSEWVNVVKKNTKITSAKYQNRGALGLAMSIRDTIGLVDDKGKVIRIEENMFLTPWQGYRYDGVVLSNNITEAKNKFNETNSDTDKRFWKEAQWEYQKWKNTYMNQDFDAGYYAANELLIKDDIGYEASERRDAIYEQMAEFQNGNDGTYDKIIEGLKIELKELSSTTDIQGVKKTGMDLDVAERLQEFSEARAEFFIEDEIPGAFQDAYDEQSAYLEATYPLDSDAYAEKMLDWVRKNSKVTLKNSVYEKNQELIDEKSEILKLLDEENKKIYDDTKEQTLINEQTRIVKDSGNQPQGDVAATAEARKKVLAAHIIIEKKREELIQTSGLSKIDNNRLRELNQNRKDGNGKFKNASDESEYNTLVNKRVTTSSRLGLNDVTKARLKEIDKLLNRESMPSDPYKATMSKFLDNVTMRTLFQEFIDSQDDQAPFVSLEQSFNQDFLDFVNSPQGEEAMKQDAGLKDFIDKNHYESTNADGVTVLKATKLWVLSQSSNPFDYKTKRLKTKDGKNDLMTIDGQYRVPSSEFQARIVKNKYETKKIIGETVDNNDNWLPKVESTNRYRNAKYYKLKEDDPDVFNFMEDLKKQYLNGQNSAISDKDKNYMSFPRTRKTRLENIVTGRVGPVSLARRTWEDITGAEDDIFEYKEGAKDEEVLDEKALRTYSMISTTVGMPVIGVYQGKPGDRMMNIEDQSTDILKTIPEYIASLNSKKGAQEANSYARSMQDVLARETQDKRNYFTQRKSSISQNSNYQQLSKGKDVVKEKRQDNKTSRSQVLDALIERDFDGIMMTGKGSKMRFLQRALDSTVKRASKMNFNFNLSSGIVNYGQMKITAMTHVLAGQEMSYKNFIRGEGYATRTAAKVSRDIRRPDHKSLDEQLFTLFDGIPGRAMETMGDTLSRTFIGDALDGKMSQNMRHWLELQGGLQNFGGMMYEKKINITDSNGNTKEISYINAFELVNGRIQSKKGVEEQYAVSYKEDGTPILGKGFSVQKLHMQNVIMKWNGAFAKKDQALAGRWLIGKQLLFLKKHVIPIASKQYSFGLGMSRHSWLPSIRKRMNYSTGEAEWGHAVSTIAFAKDFLWNLHHPSTVMYMTKSQLKGVLFTGMVIGMGALVYALWRLLTPTHVDPDEPGEDEDKKIKTDWNAMNTRSGWYDEGWFGKDGLGLFVDQEGYDFHRQDKNIEGTEYGWAMNHVSMITAKLHDEYNSVNWLGSVQGFNDMMNHTTSQSISITQSLGLVSEGLGLAFGSSPRTPTKKATGPFFFQQKGYENGNVIKLLFKSAGYLNGLGKLIDPTGAQRKYESGQRINNTERE